MNNQTERPLGEPPRGHAPRKEIMEKARLSCAAKATRCESAARSQDFLYGDDGLPE